MHCRYLGMAPYQDVFAAMREFTINRSTNEADELWLCEHPDVFTLGLAAAKDHVLASKNTPIVQTDRGGQVTYHGPGQAVAYPLLNLHRRGYFVKEYVYRLEESVIRTLDDFSVTGHRVIGAPGIYVQLEKPHAHNRVQLVAEAGRDWNVGIAKIAALGIKVSRHCTYHGASLNIHMNLEPFSRINPCGYQGLRTVDLSTIGIHASFSDVVNCWQGHLTRLLA